MENREEKEWGIREERRRGEKEWGVREEREKRPLRHMQPHSQRLSVLPKKSVEFEGLNCALTQSKCAQKYSCPGETACCHARSTESRENINRFLSQVSLQQLLREKVHI